MSDARDDHTGPVDPFPTGFGPPPVSPFPPLTQEPPPDPPSDWIETADAHDLPTRENALVALGRFAFPPAPPPDEEGVAARDRRWASRAIVFAALFLLLFNAVSPQGWARQQPPGWGTTTVQQLSDVWAAQVALLGADQPRLAVRRAYQELRDQRFIGSGPPPPTA
jgi:hypothetical protein